MAREDGRGTRAVHYAFSHRSVKVWDMICQLPNSTTTTPQIQAGTWRGSGMSNILKQCGQKFGPVVFRTCRTGREQ